MPCPVVVLARCLQEDGDELDADDKQALLALCREWVQSGFDNDTDDGTPLRLGDFSLSRIHGAFFALKRLALEDGGVGSGGGGSGGADSFSPIKSGGGGTEAVDVRGHVLCCCCVCCFVCALVACGLGDMGVELVGLVYSLPPPLPLWFFHFHSHLSFSSAPVLALILILVPLFLCFFVCFVAAVVPVLFRSFPFIFPG